MDLQRSEFIDTFKSVLKSKTSQELVGGVLFEYCSDQSLAPNVVKQMRHFLDIVPDRPLVVAYKGCMQDLNTARNADVSCAADINQSANSISRMSHKSSTGSDDGNMTETQASLSSMDLDGSPLKLKAYANLSAFDSPSSYSSPLYLKEFQFKSQEKLNNAVETQRAKTWVSLFSIFITNNINEIKNIEAIPDFWVLCDAAGIKPIIIKGIRPMFFDGRVGLKSTIVTMFDKEIDFKKEIAKDKVNISEAHCYSCYNVIEAMKEDKAGYLGSLAVDLEWKRMTHMLQSPPSYATAFVKASVSTGDMRSPVYSYYQELTLLKSFLDAVTTGDVKWIAEKNDVPLIDRVKELIENLREGDRAVIAKPDEDADDLMPLLENLIFKERQDLDFTDHLWKILITCSAYSDLVNSLQYVFNCLSTGHIQPLVLTNNQTTMAQLVRDSYTSRMMAPALKGVTPIKLLVEMGAEKLKRDYISAFLSANLTTLAHLNRLVSYPGSLEKQMEQLDKLQNVLEMVSMLKLFLRLPRATLSSSARQMIKHYETNIIDEKYVFEFPVPTSTVKSVLETCSPCVWRARFDEKHLSVTESTVYCLTKDQPFLHVQKRFDRGTAAMDTSTEDEKYFFIKKQEFVTIF